MNARCKGCGRELGNGTYQQEWCCSTCFGVAHFKHWTPDRHAVCPFNEEGA